MPSLAARSRNRHHWSRALFCRHQMVWRRDTFAKIADCPRCGASYYPSGGWFHPKMPGWAPMTLATAPAVAVLLCTILLAVLA
ncbi:hypothetical protein ACXN5S_19315 [Pseudoroseicyclus sp. H15]